MLRQRVLTAIILAPLGIALVLLFPTSVMSWVITALTIAGAWEWCGFIPIKNKLWRGAYALLTALPLALVAVDRIALPIEVFAGTGIAFWALAFAWLGFRQFAETPNFFSRLLKSLTGMLLLLSGGLSLLAIFHSDFGRALFLMFLLIIWAADVGAYFTGKAFGKHKLAPNISPGKTWEGVGGGLMLAASVFAAAFWLRFGPDQQWLWIIGLSAATALISVIGDLFVSLMKRHARLKDAGKLFPGHGGVLDRFDSMYAGAPLFLFGIGLSIFENTFRPVITP